ncbi:MAG: helix-turn-helix transcriptional regulator [Deltaproteobacteria bacterium]|nr:helix-turn-helix transcriptional regulator [Deltaproteobacteria bacterium]
MTRELTWFEKELDRTRHAFAFRLAGLEFELTEDIATLMQEKKVTRAELARRMGISRAAVTAFLRDGSNLTLKRMLRIADALGAELTVKIGGKEAVESVTDAGSPETAEIEPRQAVGG